LSAFGKVYIEQEGGLFKEKKGLFPEGKGNRVYDRGGKGAILRGRRKDEAVL